jgi:hypothetical protein
LDSFDGTQDRVGVGVEDEGFAAELGVLSQLGGGCARKFGVGEQLAAMVLDGVLGVLQRVAGEEQDGGLFPADAAVGNKLFEARERDGGGGLAADAFGADLGLGEGDLLLSDLFAPAAGGGEDADGFLPRGWIPNSDGGGAGVGRDGGE